MIQITIQTIEVGTYTLKIMAFYDHNINNKERKSSILENIKSKEIIFDIIPAALNLENSLLPVKENYYEDEYVYMFKGAPACNCRSFSVSGLSLRHNSAPKGRGCSEIRRLTVNK